MIRASNVVFCRSSLGHIVKNQVDKNSASTMHFGACPEKEYLGDEFFIFVNFVPIFRVEQDVNK